MSTYIIPYVENMFDNNTPYIHVYNDGYTLDSENNVFVYTIGIVVEKLIQRGNIYSDSQYGFAIYPEDKILELINDSLPSELSSAVFDSIRCSSDDKCAEYEVDGSGTGIDVNVLAEGYFGKPGTANVPVVSADIEGYIPSPSTYTVRANIQVYVESFYKEFDVSYYDYTGNTLLETVSTRLNMTLQLRAGTEFEGGYFSYGWYTESDGKGSFVGLGSSKSTWFTVENYPSAKELKLYEFRDKQIYTITFDANGGTSDIVSRTIGYGNEVGDLPTPTRNGYDFGGWFTAIDGGVQYTEKTVFLETQDITLYARWIERLPVVVYNLEGEGLVYMGAYTRKGDKTISQLPSDIGKEGYTFNTFALSIAGNPSIASKTGTFNTSVTYSGETYTDENGAYVRDDGFSMYAIWDRVENNIEFYANGGTGPSFGTITTKDGRIPLFPQTIRAGYIFDGWYLAEKKEGGIEFVEPYVYIDGTYVFSFDAIVSAKWTEEPEPENVVCFLERRYEGSVQRLFFPIVTSIEDSFNISLTEMDTIMYGYANRFVMDMGTKRAITVSVERVNPVDYNDSGIDVNKFSNARWWEFFKTFIDFWQNNARGENDERTGGFKFVYRPGKISRHGSSETPVDLFPPIEKNVFIAGQVSPRISPGVIRFSIPLVVANMKPDSISATWSARFMLGQDGWEVSQRDLVASAIWGLPMTLPEPSDEWVAVAERQTTPMMFKGWTITVDGMTKEYNARDQFPFKTEYTTGSDQWPVFTAVWAEVSKTHIFIMDRYVVKGGDAPACILYPKEACSVQAILYGGGGSGGRGTSKAMNQFIVAWDYHCTGGGGGGVSPSKAVQYQLNEMEAIRVTLGPGANYDTDETYRVEAGYASTVSRCKMKEDSSGNSFVDSVEDTIVSDVGGVGFDRNGGFLNGGKGGDYDEDGSKGAGSAGGPGGKREHYEVPLVTYDSFGGGGGGGSMISVNGDILGDVQATYTFKRDVYIHRLHEVNGVKTWTSESIGGKDKPVHIITMGGTGATFINSEERTDDKCDAPCSYEVYDDRVLIYTGGGGGGSLSAKHKTLGNLAYRRGAPGFVILTITGA